MSHLVTSSMNLGRISRAAKLYRKEKRLFTKIGIIYILHESTHLFAESFWWVMFFVESSCWVMFCWVIISWRLERAASADIYYQVYKRGHLGSRQWWLTWRWLRLRGQITDWGQITKTNFKILQIKKRWNINSGMRLAIIVLLIYDVIGCGWVIGWVITRSAN